MTSWGIIILIAAIAIGMTGSLKAQPRYLLALFFVAGAIAYGALKQHTY